MNIDKILRTILALLMSTLAVHAQVPALLNHQGLISAGNTNFTGTGQFQFALVNNIGTAFWSNGNSVVFLPVSQGLYSVQLGDTNVANMAALPTGVFTNSDVRLRIWFATSGSLQLLAPDQRIVSVGYALLAKTVADGAITSNKLAASAVTAAAIAPGAVGAAALADGTITSNKFAVGAVTAAALAPGAVGAAALADSTITSNKLAAGTVDNTRLANSAVLVTAGTGLSGGGAAVLGGGTTLAIATGGVVNAMLSNSVVTVAAGNGLSGGGPVALGDGITLAVNLIHDPSLRGNGGTTNLSLNLSNANIWAVSQTIQGNLGVTGDVLAARLNIGISNTVSGLYASLAGGSNNTAGGPYSAIGGGTNNNASGVGAVIGGGFGNTAASSNATVAGGYKNTASNLCAVVAGGQLNTAVGLYSAIAGGASNTASGFASFAAGYRAAATNDGAFVWGDSTASPIYSISNNSFTVRCDGGVRFLNGSQSQRVTWGPGDGAWNFTSDRNLKEGFVPVDPQSVLAKLGQLPITEWNYIGYPQRHVGPMAQDWHALFPFNASDTTLNSADLTGISLVAIQGLYQELQAAQAQNAALEKRLAELEQRISRGAQSAGK